MYQEKRKNICYLNYDTVLSYIRFRALPDFRVVHMWKTEHVRMGEIG